MSAYLVSHATINAIVAYAVAHFLPERQAVTLDHGRILFVRDANAIGNVLWQESNRSVNIRYDEATPGPMFHFDPHGPVVGSAGMFCKLLSCLDYQSCESDDWEHTAAYRLIARFRELACESMPGYEDAPWGLNDAADPAPVAAVRA